MNVNNPRNRILFLYAELTPYFVGFIENFISNSNLIVKKINHKNWNKTLISMTK